MHARAWWINKEVIVLRRLRFCCHHPLISILMSAPQSDSSSLLVRCPGCRQRFKVDMDFKGRRVACGICDQKFIIDGEVIIRVGKSYPGDHRPRGLEKIQKIPAIAVERAASSRVTTPAYASRELITPPHRIVAGIIGSCIMLAMTLFFMFADDRGKMMEGALIIQKVGIAGFAALMGFGLILYANPKRRIKASIFAGFFACGLVSIPLLNQRATLFAQMQKPWHTPDQRVDVEALSGKSAREIELDAIRERVGMSPLEREIEHHRDKKTGLGAVGLVLTDLKESNRYAVRDYVFRVMNPHASSHIYPRNGGHFLFVLTGIPIGLDEVIELIKPLGNVTQVIPELQLVKITIDNTIFVEPPSEPLTDRSSPDFYEMNLRELGSIDVERIQRAIYRLLESEPTSMRAEIAGKLRELLVEPGISFQAIIARAMRIWDDDLIAAADIATRAALEIHERGDFMPAEIISLALENPSGLLEEVLVAEWSKNNLMWENHCIRMGERLEGRMAEVVEHTSDASLRQSAARILGRIGTLESLPALESARAEANPELVIIIKRAIQLIQDRNPARPESKPSD